MAGRTLTRKGTETRRRIVEGAAAEIRDRGVLHTTLDGVLARTRASKSQLFHYFPDGKDELLLAVAAHEADQVLDDQQPHLDDLSTWEAWQAWRDGLVARYVALGPDCPLSAVNSELGRSSPGAQAVSRNLMHRWQSRLAAGIRRMQASGDIGSAVDPDRAAAALLAGVQGGVLLLLTTGSAEHLEAALDEGLDGLRR
ncbi:TetR/AcrR family transcriptional regulator [Pseudonocardia sp. WMMC193]|uniref:TetR/AcrR family transcriptional regulator n=1 Tax=Pseudonocardia sp. WMMC193 TaxID=2911965 RepID=UPI001F2C481F|nr:TetR/AcrR family transcriptional regulator [Pseudonocardia sp. WMMC193]MCF7553651.1 TetR/AcrR family transcriptional regulator [Pseudonocardia sp. WMMC193]